MKSKSFLLGILGSLFFSFTFILNRSMSLTGGNFIWSASLRYIFSLLPLFFYLKYRGRLTVIHKEISKNKMQWFLWSIVGFGLFYLPLTFASNYGTSWLVAASWQFTIVAGTLLTPLFGFKIPRKNLIYSIIILIGVFILQINNLSTFKIEDTFLCIIPIIIAAIAYPLGNRKMMAICPQNISTIERIYGMTICSLPFWIISSIIAYFWVGLPSISQSIQSLIVSIFSGIIATVLFFHATDIVRSNPKALAMTEATIAGEVVFTLIGGIIFLQDALPSTTAWIGLIIILIGLIASTTEK